MEQHNHSDCGALVIIRFPADQYQRCKNSLIKNLPIHRNYSEGEVDGIANYDQIRVHEGYHKHDTGLAFLTFEKMADAERWTFSVPEIKQPDWLGGVDMILVPCCEHERIHHKVVQILDMRIVDVEGFQSEYSPGADDIIKKHNARQFVSTDVFRCGRKIKGQWDPEYLIVNTWESEDCFNQAYYGDRNKSLQPMKTAFARTISSITCEIEPLICRH